MFLVRQHVVLCSGIEVDAATVRQIISFKMMIVSRLPGLDHQKWNDKKQQLSLYRDRIGKKPLYYALVDGQIVFASEIKAVLSHPQVSRAIDYNALYSYFSNKNISAPQTYCSCSFLPV